MQQAQIKIHDIPSEHKKILFFLCKGGQTLEQVSQRYIQNLTGHSHRQHTLSDPAWVRELDLLILRGLFQAWWLCETCDEACITYPFTISDSLGL